MSGRSKIATKIEKSRTLGGRYDLVLFATETGNRDKHSIAIDVKTSARLFKGREGGATVGIDILSCGELS